MKEKNSSNRGSGNEHYNDHCTLPLFLDPSFGVYMLMQPRTYGRAKQGTIILTFQERTSWVMLGREELS